VARSTTATAGLLFLFQKSPLRPEQVERGIELAEGIGMEILWAPGVEAVASPVRDYLTAPDRISYLAALPGDNAPETDDRPFYFRQSKWSRLLGTYSGPLGNLLVMLGVAVSFVILGIFLPLQLRRPFSWQKGKRLLPYFFAIGVGFIFLELALMVKLTLLLGHPVYAISITLASLLVFSGLGSIAAGRLREAGHARLVFAPIVVLALIYSLGLDPLVRAALGSSFAVRVALAGGIVGGLGFLLGLPMPLGIARIARSEERLVLWAWALNGGASVIGAVGCTMVARLAGYRSAFWVAAACYVAAGMVFASRQAWEGTVSPGP
jgi:hypothetical protein